MSRLMTAALGILLLTATASSAAAPDAYCRGVGDWSDLFTDARDAGTTSPMLQLLLHEHRITGPTYDILMVVIRLVYRNPTLSKAMLRLITEETCMRSGLGRR